MFVSTLANRFLYIIVLGFQSSRVWDVNRVRCDCETKIVCSIQASVSVFNRTFSGKIIGLAAIAIFPTP